MAASHSSFQDVHSDFHFPHSGGNIATLQIFLIISTCFLYLVSAGLFTRGIWFLENNTWSQVSGGDAAETGAGPGSYDIRQSVWHVNCCSPLVNGGGGWGIFNAILGWTNSATYGSVIGYDLYWLTIILWFVGMRYRERHGRIPLLEPVIQRLWPRKSMEKSPDVPSAPLEMEEGKALGSGTNYRVNEISDA